MKTQTHTPGPWATSRDAVPEWHTQITVYEEATGKRVATVFETPANAALIQAAPEMLNLCEQCLRALHEDDFPALRDELRAVIASVNVAQLTNP